MYDPAIRKIVCHLRLRRVGLPHKYIIIASPISVRGAVPADMKPIRANLASVVQDASRKRETITLDLNFADPRVWIVFCHACHRVFALLFHLILDYCVIRKEAKTIPKGIVGH